MKETLPRRTKRQKWLISLLRAYQPMTALEIRERDPKKASHNAILGSLKFLQEHGVVEMHEEKGPGVPFGSYRLSKFGERVSLGVSNFYLTYKG